MITLSERGEECEVCGGRVVTCDSCDYLKRRESEKGREMKWAPLSHPNWSRGMLGWDPLPR
jgi:hypothetical protein